MYGDWDVREDLRAERTHFKVHGNIRLHQGVTWELTDCALTIMCEYARQYRMYWEGGVFKTTRCVVGGYHDGSLRAQANFEVKDGLWDATDTTVQFCYAVSVGSGKEKFGELRGLRFEAGESPDAIIVSGDGRVHLRDSRYPIALGLHVGKGGGVSLDLPAGTPLTRTIDASSFLNGSANYEVVLEDTEVPHWFLFVRDLNSRAPPATVRIDRCENFLLSLLGRNWSGAVTLSGDLSRPVEVANTKIYKGEGEVGLRMYGGIYCGGDENDVTITGDGVVAETMCWGGTVRIDGGSDRRLRLKCTTMDAGGNARLILRNLHLGGPGRGGQIIAEQNASVIASDVTLADLLLRTEDEGSIEITGPTPSATLRIRSEGGQVVLRPTAE
ncbi:MAG: hypothetical protein AAF532_00740 [Planctomycetota bacterium]